LSFIPVMLYGMGLAVFGFTYWLLNGILAEIVALGIHKTGTIFDFLNMMWTGAILIYLIFGGWWLIRKYNEKQYMGGDMF